MPSKKPIINFHTELWIKRKMEYIANENGRSLSKEIEQLCKQHIIKYEIEHGSIKIED